MRAICSIAANDLLLEAERKFSDEEVLLIYRFGLVQGLRTIKTIHEYMHQHYASWFFHLPKYSAFVDRLNRLSEFFRLLIASLQSKKVDEEEDRPYLIDSCPIMLAQHQHAYSATVASDVAGKSYCATKKLHYYGIKIHAVARKNCHALPELEIMRIEKASRQDGPVFDALRHLLHDNLVFGDKAYKRPDEKQVEKKQNIKVITPIAKRKGQKRLDPEAATYSKHVSRMRQPIEAFFAWLNKKTGIQQACYVRSSQGLLVHVFGRMAAALMDKHYALN